VGLQALLNTLRVNGKIFHMQMDWQDEKMLATFCSYLKIKPHIRSLGPVDSKISPEAMEIIAQVLETKESKKDSYRVFNLNFDFCYLERVVFSRLCKAVAVNTCLVKLCLSNNYLGDEQAGHLMQILQENITIVDLNLAGNVLEDQFAQALSACLAKNEILQVVDISKNNIGPEGGREIYKVLGEHNDTLESLGSFERYLVCYTAIQD
jgi:Ran GTPase-activating protein (RanGAP) involved in mRNA processing and transport